ncbi:probable histone-lysine N-methyltransferase set-23 [Zerene cesonia]|uniref:probable histone-lysine N-methyltransferase set-23 n=1 Tax=Zerene cesonia TaxID=33412 RepID=UPI0018E503E0|nr:probable histone-lysine N-methyltransferase set-23 [Zerene cesonia]
MIDNYSHIDPTIFYISESIPGPRENSSEYLNLINNYNSQITQSCDCVEICPEKCDCILLNAVNNRTIQTSTNSKIDGNNEIENLGKIRILECNDVCTCSENCPNRVVQKGPIKNLSVKLCSNEAKGYGLFTITCIPKGTFICEYAGEIITKSEAERRQSTNLSRQNMNYIFCLNEVVGNKSMQTYIDPSVFGNIGRYINHSCSPNSIVLPVRINCPIPKLAIFSCRDIFPEEEITFHYGIDSFICSTQNILNERKLCLCLSPKCSGSIPFNPF